MSELERYLEQQGLAIDQTKVTARTAIITYMAQARIDNKAYIELLDPTANQQKNQINKLTRQNTKIMKMLMNEVEGEE